MSGFTKALRILFRRCTNPYRVLRNLNILPPWFPVMTHSPFHRIVLPALLASSAGFAALTWPLASSHAVQVSEKLPAPLDEWVRSALIIQRQKDLSIRYVGFATLASVALGLGTAEFIRCRQNQSARQQQRLQSLLVAQGGGAGEPGVDALKSANLFAAGEATLALVEQPQALASSSSALDWAGLLAADVSPEVDASPEVTEAAPLSPQNVPVTPLKNYRLYHLQGADQQRHLAIQVEGQPYSYYRRRATLEKAQTLAEQLQQQGQGVVLTEDEAGYAVWVHRSQAASVKPPAALPTLLTSGWPDPA